MHPPLTILRPPVLYKHLPSPIPYLHALNLQETLVARRLSSRRALLKGPLSTSPSNVAAEHAYHTRWASTDVLLLLEHTPVYTAGRREIKTAFGNVVEVRRLKKLGADYVYAMRGGLTTWHGEGQLVGYPIMDVREAKLSTKSYVNTLQDLLTTYIFSHSIPISPQPTLTGVFTTPSTKIGSIGIHIRHRITLHGFSLNIEERVLPWFSEITACGLKGVEATTLVGELRKLGKTEGEGIKVADVLPGVVETFGEAFGREMRELGTQEEDDELVRMVEDAVAGRLPPAEVAI